jgi:hypothetical protein
MRGINPKRRITQFLLVACGLALFGARSIQMPQRKLHQNQRKDIHVLTSMHQKNGLEFLQVYFDSITNQTALDRMLIHVGLVGESNNRDALVSKYQIQHPDLFQIHTFPEDSNLYEIWNKMSEDVPLNDYITNVNLDDPRKWNCIELLAAFLDNHTEFDLVSAPVRVTSQTSQLSWDACDKCDVWHSTDKAYEILLPYLQNHDEWGRVTGPYNAPHSAPMWRRSFHEYAGWFNPSLTPFSDFILWMDGLAMHRRMYFLNEPLSVYYRNPNSYSKAIMSSLEKKRIHSQKMFASSQQYHCRNITLWIEDGLKFNPQLPGVSIKSFSGKSAAKEWDVVLTRSPQTHNYTIYMDVVVQTTPSGENMTVHETNWLLHPDLSSESYLAGLLKTVRVKNCITSYPNHRQSSNRWTGSLF